MKFDKSLFPHPCNYTSNAFIDGVKYCYHAETEPHTHHDADEDIWVVVFHYFNRRYKFVYYIDGQVKCVSPKLGKPYKFQCKKLHAVIKTKDVPLFKDEKYWRKKFGTFQEVEGPLACVFTFDETKFE
jgi:hypothetical protein